MFRAKYCRDIAFKLIYLIDALHLGEESKSEQILELNRSFISEINDEEKKFILKLVNKTRAEKEKIDKLISDSLISWKLERLMAIDRALLRLGLADSYFTRHKAVIIDDVIRLAKKYGTPESYKIINAVLDNVLGSKALD